MHATQDDSLSAFLCVQPRLFRIAYRMFGNAAEAEDIVQDVWVRWQTADRRAIRNPAAFLVTATTRLAINVLQSARARRETGVDSWQPEPVDRCTNPGLDAERSEAVSRAMRLLLERLTPTERAAFVLREAFSYPYREIAETLRIEAANARQLVRRARERVSGPRRAAVTPVAHRHLLRTFVTAARTGDLAGLETVFASDARPAAAGGREPVHQAAASLRSRECHAMTAAA
jgi:RNA polymerase sigma-70 factor (ECF subfamily)